MVRYLMNGGDLGQMNKSGCQTYQHIDIFTADPKRLIILCYEGVIKNLASAKYYHLSDEFEKKGKAVQNALEIINALREALDFEKGGEIAKNLDLIYGYSIKHILNSDLKRNLEGFDRIIFLMSELKSAWEEALFGGSSRRRINSPQSSEYDTPPQKETSFE